MNPERIGNAAGAVWHRLRDRAESGCTVNEVKRNTPGYTADEIMAGIGWLARESKVTMTSQGRKTILSLSSTELTCTN